MDKSTMIARNLSAWMAGNERLGTLKQVSAKAGVGFGTVRRAKNGDGNITIQNLVAIAGAFGRSVEDLLAPPNGAPLATVIEIEPPFAREDQVLIDALHRLPSALQDLKRAEIIWAATEPPTAPGGGTFSGGSPPVIGPKARRSGSK